MIATKFCDVCDTELPPMSFHNSYESADAALHENHPDKSWSSIRITASPVYTNGDRSRRPDLCPVCFLNLCKALVLRMEKRNRKSASALNNWKQWRQASQANETERDGCNKQRRPELPQG